MNWVHVHRFRASDDRPAASLRSGRYFGWVLPVIVCTAVGLQPPGKASCNACLHWLGEETDWTSNAALQLAQCRRDTLQRRSSAPASVALQLSNRTPSNLQIRQRTAKCKMGPYGTSPHFLIDSKLYYWSYAMQLTRHEQPPLMIISWMPSTSTTAVVSI